MKPLLQLIRGGNPPQMKFASFGRERDLSLIEQYCTDAVLKAKWLRQTSAAHDLNDGAGTIGNFLDASREAIFPVSLAARDPAMTLLARVSNYYSECDQIWNELAESSLWQDRFTVACRLYWSVPEGTSDRLYNELRCDRSKRVRDIALDRYSNRPNEKREIILGVYDPELFDERVRNGEVKV